MLFKDSISKQAEVLVIGDEVVSGLIVDTNSKYLGEQIHALGIGVSRITKVGDDPSIIEQCVTQALQRSRWIILTGGLGITHDDITKSVLIKVFGSGLRKDKKVETMLQEVFSKRNREVPESVQSQCEVPDNCQVLYNDVGTAPGLRFEKDGNVLSMKPEPYFIIDLPIPYLKNDGSIIRTSNIYNCFEQYCQGERLEGENGWLNEKTNEKEDVDKKIVFWSLPKILVLDLKRFTPTGKKIQSPIDIELDDLDLGDFVEGYEKDSYKYELYGICNHSGGTLGGHYTATIKNKNNEWYLFNDTNISKINNFSGNNNTSGYCLFYRKKLNK